MLHWADFRWTAVLLLEGTSFLLAILPYTQFMFSVFPDGGILILLSARVAWRSLDVTLGFFGTSCNIFHSALGEIFFWMPTPWEHNCGADFSLVVYHLPESGLLEAKLFRNGFVTFYKSLTHFLRSSGIYYDWGMAGVHKPVEWRPTFNSEDPSLCSWIMGRDC